MEFSLPFKVIENKKFSITNVVAKLHNLDIIAESVVQLTTN